MKKIFACGTALALVLAATSVQAQSYTNADNVKNHDSTLNNAQTVQPQKQSEAAQAESAPSVEPAAGDSGSSMNYDRRTSFNGPYVGADVNYNFGRAKINDPAGPDGTADVRGWGGGGFAGYGYVFPSTGMHPLYLGGELGYDWSNASGDVGGPSFSEKRNFIATVRPGIVMNDSMLGYGIGGYSRADFRGAGDSHQFDGYVLGLGAEASMHASPLKARLEYTYSSYNSDDVGGVSFKPRSNEVKLGLLYQFPVR